MTSSSCSHAAMKRPLPCCATTTSLSGAGAVTDSLVRATDPVVDQKDMESRSAMSRRESPSAVGWKRSRRTGEPFIWSQTRRGRADRTSYRLTTPEAVPTARVMPSSPIASSVTSPTPSPKSRPPMGCPGARASQQATVPLAHPAAMRGSWLPSVTQLIVVSSSGTVSGDRYSPVSRFSRPSSGAAPAKSKSALSHRNAMSRQRKGSRISANLPEWQVKCRFWSDRSMATFSQFSPSASMRYTSDGMYVSNLQETWPSSNTFTDGLWMPAATRYCSSGVTQSAVAATGKFPPCSTTNGWSAALAFFRDSFRRTPGSDDTSASRRPSPVMWNT
mmetsp:Transcript_8112/g.25931  ORF Transcript_8112/g.25931 Transcript_8112/m.25931 type:complete len:332 (+) Transcript_8112:789-1784(+)